MNLSGVSQHVVLVIGATMVGLVISFAYVFAR